MTRTELSKADYDLTLNGLARRYKNDGDQFFCRSCLRNQHVSWRARAFQHRAGCRNKHAPSRPWEVLIAAIAASPLAAEAPDA